MANKWDYRRKLKESENWKIPNSEKEALKIYCNEYASGRITRTVPNKPDPTIESALSRLKIPLEHINKSFDRAVFMPSKLKDNKPNKNYKKELKQYEKDKKIYLSNEILKSFVDELLQNKIKIKIEKYVKKVKKKVEIKPYSNTGKDRILEYLSTYVKFRFRDKEIEEAKLLKILDVNINTAPKEPKTLTKEEIEKMILECDLEKEVYLRTNKAIGTRGGEFHTIQMQGIRFPDLTQGRRWLEIDIIESKTKTRTVKVYDPEDAGVISEYYNQRIKEGAKQTDLFFPKSHVTMRQWLRRASKRILGKYVHPHMLRASSVTINAESGLINEDSDMNKFYGWVPGTGTSRRYLSMSKLSLKNVDKKAAALEDVDYNKKLKKVEAEKNIEIEKLMKDNDDVKGKLNKFVEYIPLLEALDKDADILKMVKVRMSQKN